MWGENLWISCPQCQRYLYVETHPSNCATHSNTANTKTLFSFNIKLIGFASGFESSLEAEMTQLYTPALSILAGTTTLLLIYQKTDACVCSDCLTCNYNSLIWILCLHKLFTLLLCWGYLVRWVWPAFRWWCYHCRPRRCTCRHPRLWDWRCGDCLLPTPLHDHHWRHKGGETKL